MKLNEFSNDCIEEICMYTNLIKFMLLIDNFYFFLRGVGGINKFFFSSPDPKGHVRVLPSLVFRPLTFSYFNLLL